jgi:cell division septum initiation protein DivIVA
MVRCKNASGAPSDGDDSPPRRTEVARGKRVKIAAKKRKRTLIEAELAQAVADAADATERGGRSSGIRIGESHFHLEGRQLGTDATEKTVEATEETVDAPAEQPSEDPQETKEQTAQTPQRRRSGRTRAHVTPRLEGQCRGGRPPPRARGHPPVEHFDLRGATARQV